MKARHIAALWVGWTVAACVGGSNGRPTASVRDSAGIRIVENSKPLWHAEETWRLSAEPIAEIGNRPGDPNHELFEIRNAVRLDDGSIVVANGGTKELRFYDASGEHLRTVGGEGGGPGEFNELRWMQRLGDTLIVYDPFPPRFLYFDLDGNHARSYLFPAPKNDLYPLRSALFDDGSVLATLATFDPNDRPEGLIRRPVTYARYDETGTGDTLGTFPGSETFARPFGEAGRSYTPPLFRRFTYVFPYANHFGVATNDTYEIKMYSLAGELESLIRKQHQNLAVRQTDIDLLREQRLGFAPNDEWRARMERTLLEMPVPETMPAYGWSRFTRSSPVHVDDDGNLWVIEYGHVDDERIHWSVFDGGGQWLGIVEFSVWLEPLHIGTDFVLGLVKDELDVEHLRLYELVKPAT